MLTILRLLARLPLNWLHRGGALAGWLVFRLSGRYRRKMLSNLEQAGYSGDPPWVAQAVREAGRMVGEMPFIWFRPLEEVLDCVVCDDDAVLETAERAGRGILFMTPHLGAFEVTARYYARRAPITVLFKPPKSRWLAPVEAAARNFPGMSSAPANLGGLRTLLRCLRRGEAIGLLPDQVPTGGEGRWSDFFGRPAYTMTLPQRLAQQTGAAVVLAVGERLAGSRGWRLHLELMSDVPTPDAINRAMQRLITRFPTQYLWSYNRYKQPAGVPAP